MAKPILYSPEAFLLQPFCEAARSMCRLDRVKLVVGVSRASGPWDGLIECLSKKPTRQPPAAVRITLRIGSLDDPSKGEYWAEVLTYLAHELAHTVHWEHTEAHLELTAKLLAKFAKVFKKLGHNDTYSRYPLLNKRHY